MSIQTYVEVTNQTKNLLTNSAHINNALDGNYGKKLDYEHDGVVAAFRAVTSFITGNSSLEELDEINRIYQKALKSEINPLRRDMAKQYFKTYNKLVKLYSLTEFEGK